MKLKVGEKVKFCTEVQRYTIQALDERYLIMSKPFNARETYLYTVVDLDNNERGHFGRWGPREDVNTHTGARRVLQLMNDGMESLPSKYCIPLTAPEREQMKEIK